MDVSVIRNQKFLMIICVGRSKSSELICVIRTKLKQEVDHIVAETFYFYFINSKYSFSYTLYMY